MNNDEFLPPFEELCAAFDKAPRGREAMAAVYFQAFQHLTGAQWAELCRRASRTMERFPTIHMLAQAARGPGGLLPRSPDDRRCAPRPVPWISVECSCGEGFVVARSEKASARPACPSCRQVYSLDSLRAAAGERSIARYGRYKDR